MGAPKVTPEMANNIREDNKNLSGSMQSRSLKLGRKYGLTRQTISKLIRETVKVQIPITDMEKIRILKLYQNSPYKVMAEICRAISSVTGRSVSSIRSIILESESEETKLFNHKQEMF